MTSMHQRPPPSMSMAGTPQPSMHRPPPVSHQFSTPQSHRPPQSQNLTMNPPMSQQFNSQGPPMSQRPPPSQNLNGPESSQRAAPPASQRPPPSQQFSQQQMMSQRAPQSQNLAPMSQQFGAPMSQRAPPSQNLGPPQSTRLPPMQQSSRLPPMSNRQPATDQPPMSQSMHPAPSGQLSSRSYAPGPITYQPGAPPSGGPLSTNSDFMDTLQSAATRSVRMPAGLPSQRRYSMDEELAVQEDDDDIGGGDPALFNTEPQLFRDRDTGYEAETLARNIRPYSAARTRDSSGGARSVSGIEAFLKRKTELDRAGALGEEAPSQDLTTEQEIAEAAEGGVAGGPEDTMLKACDLSDTSLVEQLLKEQVDPNLQGVQGETPLMYAARSDSAAIVQVLLRHAADPNLCDHKGGTALRQSLRGRSMRSMAVLLHNGVDVDQRDAGGRTLLMLAAADGDDEAVRMLLSMGAATEKRCMGYTALIIAVREGWIEVVRTLLNEGKTAIDKAGPKGVTALMYACSLGHHQLVLLLLENGADPLVMDNLGYRASDFAKGKWPDVTAVFEQFGYKGACSWMCSQWLQQTCPCLFSSQNTSGFPEPNSDLEATYQDDQSDDTLQPRAGGGTPAQQPRMSMGPQSRRSTQSSGSSRRSTAVGRDDVAAAVRRYGVEEDNKSRGSADSDTPLVDRYPNALAAKDTSGARKLSLDLQQPAEQEERMEQSAEADQASVGVNPNEEEEDYEIDQQWRNNSNQPPQQPVVEKAPPSQTMDC